MRWTLELAQKNIVDHTSSQRKRKARVISEYAVMARSIIRKKFQQFQESAIAERLKEEEKAVNDAKSDRVKDPVLANTSAIGKTQNIDTTLGMATNGKVQSTIWNSLVFILLLITTHSENSLNFQGFLPFFILR